MIISLKKLIFLCSLCYPLLLWVIEGLLSNIYTISRDGIAPLTSSFLKIASSLRKPKRILSDSQFSKFFSKFLKFNRAITITHLRAVKQHHIINLSFKSKLSINLLLHFHNFTVTMLYYLSALCIAFRNPFVFPSLISSVLKKSFRD